VSRGVSPMRRAAARRCLQALLFGLTLIPLCLSAAHAQPAEERLAADLREEVQQLEVSVKDLYGRQERATIALTVYRPPGDGPFPLAILSHGRASGEQRGSPGRLRFESVGRYLVGLGFAVFVPTRLGYGDTYRGGFDPEDSGPCQAKRWEPMATAASDQVLATHAHARQFAWVDAGRWVALGQSVGGLATLAAAARRPPGLAGAINFSGGSGGDPVNRVADPCGAWELARLWRAQGASAGELPTLWIYWTHDRYWGERHPRRWAEAWREGGGRVWLHQLPPWSPQPVDGHVGITRDMASWAPLVEKFLADLGFRLKG
jgi:dienelactone hydrolase